MKKKEELKEIIQEERIYPVFQPIVSLHDGKILGYEALSRIAGNSTIQNMEEFFMLGVLYDKTWEVEKLCRKKILQEYARISDENRVGKLFINVNPLVMRDENFKKNYTKKQLEKRNINADKIVIEVTERNTIDNCDELRETITHYKKEGYQIAIDDLGSCFSGLNAIANTYPQYIKVNMGLIRGVDQDPMRQALIKGLVEMSNHTSFELIAEGIETENELEMLMKLGVHYGQGYFLGKPDCELLPIKKNIIDKLTELDSSLKKNFWNGKEYSLLRISIHDYHAIDAYSEKYGELRLGEVFRMLFDAVKNLLFIYEGMYILDENSCVVIIEKNRYSYFGEKIVTQFNLDLKRLYSRKDINNGFVEIVSKKGNRKKYPLMSVSVELMN